MNSNQEFIRNFLSEYKVSPIQTELTSYIKKIALSKIHNIEFPDATMESWRKFSFSNFKLNEYIKDSEYTPFEELKSHSHYSIKDFSKLTENETRIARRIIEKYFDENSNNYFGMLNLLFFQQGIFVDIPSDYNTKEIISIPVSFPKTNISFYPLVIVNVSKFSKAQIAISFDSYECENFLLLNPLILAYANSGSTLTLILIEDISSSAFHFQNVCNWQEESSNLNTFYFNLGGFRGKTLIENSLIGKLAYSNIYGASALKKKEFLDVEVTVKHLESKTDSKLKFKSVVKDKSHNLFTGNLFIPKSSSGVSASQISNNLLMNRTARAEAMPKLEVFADDVKCSHGATIGEVSVDQMFFLMSRGLTEEEARNLIVEGFFSEIIDKIEESELVEWLRARLLAKMV